MTMAETERDEELGVFFDAAKAAPEPVSDALMARVLNDALAVQAGAAVDHATATDNAADRGRPGLFAGLLAALGGWPAVAGLATAAVTGIWIGFSPALGVGDAMTSALGAGETSDAYLVDYATGYEFAFEEGDAG